MKIRIPTERELSALRRVHKYLYPDWPDPYAAFDRLNKLCFNGKLPTLPIERGLMPYGKCVGLTSCHLVPPRITLGTYRQLRGEEFHNDVLVHEMLHAWLAMLDENPGHNDWPWCREIVRITPLLGLRPILAVPVHPKRIDGISVRKSLGDHLTRKQIVSWPYSIRNVGSEAS